MLLKDKIHSKAHAQTSLNVQMSLDNISYVNLDQTMQGVCQPEHTFV